MFKNILLALTLLLLPACSLTPFDAFSDKPQINANVGKNVEQEANTAKVEVGKEEVNQEINQEAEQISNDTNQTQTADVIENITQQLPNNIIYLLAGLVVVIVFMAGWAIPDPKQTGKGLRVLVIDLYKGIRFVAADQVAGLLDQGPPPVQKAAGRIRLEGGEVGRDPGRVGVKPQTKKRVIALNGLA